MTDPFNVKSEILSAIAKTDDVNLKMILLLMLGVLDEISSKIDNVLKDEQALKSMVLNGHSSRHHEHHDWIDSRMREAFRLDALIARAEPLMAWADKKMTDERETAKQVKQSIWNVVEAGFKQAAIVIVTALITMIIVSGGLPK